MTTAHCYSENLFAARRVMRDFAPNIDFSRVLTHLELHEFDAAIRELGQVEYVPDANVIPNPIFVIAGEIRNAKRYYAQTEQADAR